MTEFGVDVHSEYQSGFDFDRAYDVGMRFAFIKASEGVGFVPLGTVAFAKAAEAAAKSRAIVGFYHFLNDMPGTEQARFFLRTLDRLGDGPNGNLLAVDYEPNGAHTAGDSQLRGFIAELRRHRVMKPIVVYSGSSFWNGDAPGSTPSPCLDTFGSNLVRWDARYPDMDHHDRPREYHDRMRDWYLGQRGWGCQPAKFWQFTSAGLVAGDYVDVNAFYGDVSDLQRIAGMSGSDVDGRPPAPEPAPDPDDPKPADPLKRDVEDAIAFGMAMLGAPYGMGWRAGTWPDLSPLYARITSHDPPSWYRVRECVCSGFINVLRFEVCDLPAVGRRQGDAFPGGTAAIGRHLAFAEGSRPYPPVENTPRGWLVWSPFLGDPLALQGHVGIALGNGLVLEARVPRLSANRTENEGSTALVRGGGRPYTRIIPPSLWLRK